MKKIILAASVAVIATLSFASTSQAGYRHHNNAMFDIDVTFESRHQRYDDDYGYMPRKRVQYDIGYENDEPECFWRKTKKINRWGELVIKKVQICR